jgi:gliding motility-associated-like protein
MTFFLKRLFILLILCSGNKVFSQSWPPTFLGSLGEPWSEGFHVFLAKAKFSPKGDNYFSLHNILFFGIKPAPNDIGVDGIKQNARKKYNNAIPTANEKDYHGIYNLTELSHSYGIDFESDDVKNIYLLGENYATDSGQVVFSKKSYTNNLIWRKLIGGSKIEQAYTLKWAGDGNLIALLQTQSNDGDVTGYNGGKDIWLVKIDSANGNIIWKKTFGSSANEIPADMEILPDRSILIAGAADASTFFPSPYVNTNAFVMKLDEFGNVIWKKTFGGDGNDAVKSITLINDGGFVTSGTSTSSNGDIGSNAGGTDVFVIKHDANGNIIWKKNYGNTNNDEACDVIYKPCDSMIIISYAKQFTNNTYNPLFPSYCQLTGIQVGLYNNGTQFFFQENDFPLPNNGGYPYISGAVYNTMASAKQESILLGLCSNDWIKWDFPQPVPWNVYRTCTVYEFGAKLKLKNFDTSICAGQLAWGNPYFIDTSFSDTLRNACLSDTLINYYKVHIINADTTHFKDSTVCYGQLFSGVPVFTSFNFTDTTIANTVCGPRRLINKIHVNVAPQINLELGPNLSLCNTNNILLSVSHPLSTYLWQDNSTLPSYSATTSGLYWVQITDTAGCKKRDSINITIENLYLSVNRNETIYSGRSVQLIPQTNGTVTWQANPALSCTVCQTANAAPTTTTIFYLLSQKNSCSLNDSIKVLVKYSPYVYVPNAFTPDNNTLNDFFKVETNITSEITMQVFNRWGQKIFETKDARGGWDGKVNGLSQQAGTYVYVITYKGNFTEMQTEKGSFLLLR